MEEVQEDFEKSGIEGKTGNKIIACRDRFLSSFPACSIVGFKFYFFFHFA